MAAAQPPSDQGLKWVDTTLQSWADKKPVNIPDLIAIKRIIESALTANDNLLIADKLSELYELCEQRSPSFNDVAVKAAEVFSLVHPILEKEMKADRKEWVVEEFEEPGRETGAGAAAAAATAAGAAASAADAVTSPVQSQIEKDWLLRSKLTSFPAVLTKFEQSNKSEADFNELMQAGWLMMKLAHNVAKFRISNIKGDKTRPLADAQRAVQDFEDKVSSVWTTMKAKKPQTLASTAEQSFREQNQACSRLLEGIKKSVSDEKIYKNEAVFNKPWDEFSEFVKTQIGPT